MVGVSVSSLGVGISVSTPYVGYGVSSISSSPGVGVYVSGYVGISEVIGEGYK